MLWSLLFILLIGQTCVSECKESSGSQNCVKDQTCVSECKESVNSCKTCVEDHRCVSKCKGSTKSCEKCVKDLGSDSTWGEVINPCEKCVEGQECASKCKKSTESCKKCVEGQRCVSKCIESIKSCECVKAHESNSPCKEPTESCKKCVKDLCNSQNSTLNGTTSQSSVFVGGKNPHSSDRALDGKAGLCAHTNEEENSWWTIDLLGVYDISSITIFNTHSDITNLSGAQILIGNSRENNGITNSICTNITDFKTLECNVYKCNKTTSGRYITVHQSRLKHVILCEVRINGTKKESRFELITKNKTWEESLNYCRKHHMNLASILNEEDQAWAELEAKEAKTTFVWLGLRYSCVLDFWFWVADHHLEFSRWAPEKKTGECDMSAAMKKTKDYQWFSKPDNEKFNFICEKY